MFFFKKLIHLISCLKRFVWLSERCERTTLTHGRYKFQVKRARLQLSTFAPTHLSTSLPYTVFR